MNKRQKKKQCLFKVECIDDDCCGDIREGQKYDVIKEIQDEHGLRYRLAGVLGEYHYSYFSIIRDDLKGEKERIKRILKRCFCPKEFNLKVECKEPCSTSDMKECWNKTFCKYEIKVSKCNYKYKFRISGCSFKFIRLR